MSDWVQPPPLELQLWYGDMLVADLHQMFPHQGTWFATYDLKIAPGQGALQDRVLEYIAFSEDFHGRMERGEDHDHAEFDRFGPVADTCSWRVPSPDGDAVPMEGRLLFAWRQAVWQHPETTPSTEGAANNVWVRIAERVSACDQSGQAKLAEPDAVADGSRGSDSS